MRCFGRLTWPRISELIISSFLSKLPDFQKIIVCSSEFEKCNGPFGWLQCFSLTYSRESDFEEGNHFYRFFDHEPLISKCFNFRGTTNDSEPKAAAAVCG
ncbi:hypothetical protein JHK82_055679 [Glycine max]|uniref:Uncharacterized protein n=1 Tax=Glycine max TaxID=3847 RepID=C6T728_SOYBN|nr:uncharacterized protein LOC100802584 isoform 1 [Glycine max]ACU17630.1 unknown [Glycine max]KAG4909658.1 hypothetical protein JHK87_055774 [Glycine soja]KAG5076984.1 hypothetical protein JHK82_055679 [Glycine max]|eukprot:NP_001239757.1 uncharacterized protein LOC100802584 [Glycine max]